LAEALRKAADFIRVTEICVDNSDVPKKTKVPRDKNFNRSDRNPGSRDRRPPFEAVDHQFTTNIRSIHMEVRGHPMPRRLPPMTTSPKSQNARKYCEFYKQSGYTTVEVRDLTKAFHELADKGQIDHFLKRGRRFLRREQELAQPQPRDKECSTEVAATIARGYAEGITRSAWKAQLRSAQQVLTMEQGPHVTAPTMVFRGKEVSRCAFPHNDPLVIEMKISSAIVR